MTDPAGAVPQDIPSCVVRRLRLSGLLLLLASSCHRTESAPVAPPVPTRASAPEPARVPVVKVGCAWVVASAPTEVRQVGAILAVQIVEASGERRAIQVGTWWRSQRTLVEIVAPSAAPGVLFETKADFGSVDEPHDAPEFQIVREVRGDLVVQGRSASGPWRELARVPVSVEAKVERLDGLDPEQPAPPDRPPSR